MCACSWTVVSTLFTAFHAQVFFCWLLAVLTCVQNMADWNPRARWILWMDSLAWAIQSLASLTARDFTPLSIHHFQLRVDGRRIGRSSGLWCDPCLNHQKSWGWPTARVGHLPCNAPVGVAVWLGQRGPWRLKNHFCTKVFSLTS